MSDDTHTRSYSAAALIARLIDARRELDHDKVRASLAVLRNRHGIHLGFARELEGGDQ